MIKFCNVVLCQISLISFLASVTFPQPQSGYEIKRIGEARWISKAINDSSEVAGYYFELPSEYHYPFVWKDGESTFLTLPGEGDAFDINNNSHIVGVTAISPGLIVPVLWRSPDSFSVINMPEGYNYSVANALNDAGVVAGYASINYDSLRKGFIYDNGLSLLPGYAGCDPHKSPVELWDINNLGVAVGYRVCNDTLFYAIKWENGAYTDFGPQVYFRKINNLGHIAGNKSVNAAKWIDDIPYIYANGVFSSTAAVSINDSSVMVGSALLASQRRAVKYVGDQIIDLNTLLPLDSTMVLTEALDINNKGEILVMGHYPANSDIYCWVLREPKDAITHPAAGELAISGMIDSVRWTGGPGDRRIDILFSSDGGSSWSGNTIAADIPGDTGRHRWNVPFDTYSRKALVKIVDNATGETILESDTFRIKPLIITKLDPNGNYLPYDIEKDRWGFGNLQAAVWPPYYYSRFDYLGIDPFTGFQYDLFEGGGAFYLSDPADFPDWESFVRAFSVGGCYRSITPPVAYSLTALERWAAKKSAWGGSCFGIAASNALIFEKKQDYISHFPGLTPFTEPAGLTTPDTGEIAAISALFAHQFGNPSRANDDASYNIKTPNQTLAEIIDMLKDDSVTIKTLTLFNNNGPGAHTILPYQVEHYEADQNFFYVMVYDNSYPNVIDGFIEIDTSANGGNGGWNASYGLDNWGGFKNLYLETRASDYLTPAAFNKISRHHSPFVLGQDELEINTTKFATIKIKDSAGNGTGFKDSLVMGDIPGSRPLMTKNGNEEPPYGYLLPGGSYSVEMSDFTDTDPSLHLFTGNRSYGVKRKNASPDELDRINIQPGGKIGIINPPGQPVKSIEISGIINEPEDEKMFIIKNLGLEGADSLEVADADSDKVRLTNPGDMKSYELELQFVSQNGFDRFRNGTGVLPANSSQIIAPDWSHLDNIDVTVLLDLGNDGTVDDTLRLDNELTQVGDEDRLLPEEYLLGQNYPNPFNPNTVINYQLPRSSRVVLRIHNLLGQEVRTLVEGDEPGGFKEVEWNSTDNGGNDLPSGVYFYRLDATSLDGPNYYYSQIRKMLLVR